MTKKIKVLAIDSGGISGLMSGRILQELEYLSGKPISESFDYLIGNSAGAFFAAGLLVNDNESKAKYDAKTLLNEYKNACKLCFTSSFSYKLTNGFGLWGPKYDRAKMDDALNNLFGNIKLNETNKSFITFSYSLSDKKIYRWSNENILLSDVIGASMAAPTYFSPKKINFNHKEDKHIDAGMIKVNSILLGIAAIKELNPNVKNEDLEVISIGGRIPPHNDFDNMTSYGYFGWLKQVNLYEIMMYEDYLATNDIASKILPNYYRLQVNPTVGAVGIDNTHTHVLDQLIIDTECYLKQNGTLIILDEIIQNFF